MNLVAESVPSQLIYFVVMTAEVGSVLFYFFFFLSL